jgi:hypothetical protein
MLSPDPEQNVLKSEKSPRRACRVPGVLYWAAAVGAVADRCDRAITVGLGVYIRIAIRRCGQLTRACHQPIFCATSRLRSSRLSA